MKPARFLLPGAIALAMATGAEARIGLAAPLTGANGVGRRGKFGVRRVGRCRSQRQGRRARRKVELITVDDYCDGEQAVAAANKLVTASIVAVVGHQCSGAAIPASRIYSDAGILMIANNATNPKLTEQGFTNVFRVIGRDDLQGQIAGDLLVERWGSTPIAILHDGQAYGKGLAEKTKKRLN